MQLIQSIPTHSVPHLQCPQIRQIYGPLQKVTWWRYGVLLARL